MKVGDLAKCKFTMKRKFGSFVVCFPNAQIRHARKGFGLSEKDIEVINESR